MSQVGIFPRVFTIVVPDDIDMQSEGDYVTSRMSQIVMELGAASYVPRSVSISPHPTKPHVYLIQLLTTTPYETKVFHTRGLQREELQEVAEEGLPQGNQDRPIKTSKAGAFRK